MLTPECIMMVGLPGSGKSTLIKKFLYDAALVGNSYVVISTDDIIQAEADKTGKTYSDLWKDMIGPATSLVNTQFRDAIAQGSNIIWDQTNVSAKKRMAVLRMVPKNYYKVAKVLLVSLDILKIRLDNRAKETGKHIPFNTVMGMYDRFEMPTEAEGFDEVQLHEEGALC